MMDYGYSIYRISIEFNFQEEKLEKEEKEY